MPKTLLLADDSVTIQKVVGITFANEDVELVTENNGDDALRRARELKPDLVLADVGMPGLDGYELCAALRADPELSNTPVLLLTGTFQPFDAARAREVGASGHVSKPFEAQTLVDTVRKHLDEAAAAPPPAAASPAPWADSPAAPEELELPNSDFGGSSATTEVETAATPSAADDPFRFEDLDFAEPESSNSQTDLFGAPSKPSAEPMPESDTPSTEGIASSAAGGETLFLNPLADRPPDDTPAPRKSEIDEADGETAPDMEPVAPATGDEATVVAMAPELGPEHAEPVAESLPEIPEDAFIDAAPAAAVDTPPFLADAVPILEEEPIDDALPLPSPVEPASEPLEALLAEAVASERERTGEPQPAPPASDPELAVIAAPASAGALASAADAPSLDGAPSVDGDAVKKAVERIAWEALGDLSEHLVREVVAKVEAIAWEVVPEMAERILGEEIERLKRETD